MATRKAPKKGAHKVKRVSMKNTRALVMQVGKEDAKMKKQAAERRRRFKNAKSK